MIQGILPINKPKGITSFDLVRSLRRHLGVKKIGHTGTLDPFATGVMILLIGKDFTRLSDKFLNQEKEYIAKICLGVSTDSFDCDGKVVKQSALVPELPEIERVLSSFQGTIQQLPPMFSAKKKNGKKLYLLARQGLEIEREPVEVQVETKLLAYNYPFLEIQVKCSKGTYIRAMAEDIGNLLGCGGHLAELKRIRSGNVRIEECLDGTLLDASTIHVPDLESRLIS